MMTETFAPDQFDQFYLKNGVADNCDRFLQSWATWEWKTFCRKAMNPYTVSLNGQNMAVAKLGMVCHGM